MCFSFTKWDSRVTNGNLVLQFMSHKNHMKGPRKRTEEDDVRFAQSFEKLILMAKSKEGAQSGTI